MEPSIFTKIINGEIPSHKVYEDEKTLAFLDVHPSRPGHTLVVSKNQVDRLDDLPEEDYRALMETVKKLMTHLRGTLGVDRTCLKLEGFEVPHAHVHLIPCDNAADFNAVPDAHAKPDHDALAKMAERIKLT